MERIPKAVYTPEFREQAVQLYEESGLSLATAAQRLSMPKGTLKHWIDTDRDGKLKEIGRNQKPLSGLEVELARVKRELAETRMERDFLKKCTAYFAKMSR